MGDSMRRDLFTDDHESFQQLARDFIEKDVAPHYPEWEKAGRMPRDVFKQMGALGMLGMAIPEEYGGAGVADTATTWCCRRRRPGRWSRSGPLRSLRSCPRTSAPP